MRSRDDNRRLASVLSQQSHLYLLTLAPNEWADLKPVFDLRGVRYQAMRDSRQVLCITTQPVAGGQELTNVLNAAVRWLEALESNPWATVETSILWGKLLAKIAALPCGGLQPE